MKFKILVFWLSIIFIFVLGFYLLFYLKTESFQCISNPYIYSIGLLEEANSAEVSCICTVHKPRGASAVLTRNGFEPIEQEVEEKEGFTEFNFSGLRINNKT
jgi:hypothetical protein